MHPEPQGDPELIKCLTKIQCEHHISVFIQNEIDFECFQSLTKDDLNRLIPGKVGPQKKLLKEIERLNNQSAGSTIQSTKTTEVRLTASTVNQSTTIPTKKSQPPSTTAGIKPQANRVATPNANPNTKAVNSQASPGSNTATAAGVGNGPQIQPNDPGFLAKNGIALPSPAGFAASIALGVASRCVINKIVGNSKTPNTQKDASVGDTGTTTAAGPSAEALTGTVPIIEAHTGAGSISGASTGVGIITGTTPDPTAEIMPTATFHNADTTTSGIINDVKPLMNSRSILDGNKNTVSAKPEDTGINGQSETQTVQDSPIVPSSVAEIQTNSTILKSPVLESHHESTTSDLNNDTTNLETDNNDEEEDLELDDIELDDIDYSVDREVDETESVLEDEEFGDEEDDIDETEYDVQEFEAQNFENPVPSDDNIEISEETSTTFDAIANVISSLF